MSYSFPKLNFSEVALSANISMFIEQSLNQIMQLCTLLQHCTHQYNLVNTEECWSPVTGWDDPWICFVVSSSLPSLPPWRCPCHCSPHSCSARPSSASVSQCCWQSVEICCILTCCCCSHDYFVQISSLSRSRTRVFAETPSRCRRQSWRTDCWRWCWPWSLWTQLTEHLLLIPGCF